MRSHPGRPARLLLSIGAAALLVGCGGSDGSDGADAPGSPSPEAAVAAAGDGAGGDSAAVRDLPGSGLTFRQTLEADDLTDAQRSELEITLNVIGLDHAGYVSGTTIVVETTGADSDDQQFTCIAAGQMSDDDDEYQVVVVDEAGTDLDC